MIMKITAKKINWFFLILILITLGGSLFISFFMRGIKINVYIGLIISQLFIFIPAVLFILVTRMNPKQFIQMKKIKLTSAVLIAIVTFLTMPILVAVNAASMLWVENEVNQMADNITGMPMIAAMLLIGILGPLNEEFVCRGIIYHGYRKTGRMIGAAVLSSILFGLLHMNFNQMSYAILVGIFAVILIEATGSLWSSVIYHCLINASNVILMYQTKGVSIQAGQDIILEGGITIPYKTGLMISMLVYFQIGLIALLIAGGFVYLIAKNEGRIEHLKWIRSASKSAKGKKLLSVPLGIGIILCIAFMIINVV